jgi:outer membrane murein-binding lipoprotein Lpp
MNSNRDAYARPKTEKASHEELALESRVDGLEELVELSARRALAATDVRARARRMSCV